MNPYGDFYMACDGIANARGLNPKNPEKALANKILEFKELCSTDVIVQEFIRLIPRTQLPDFDDLPSLIPYLEDQLKCSSIYENPNWLMYNH